MNVLMRPHALLRLSLSSIVLISGTYAHAETTLAIGAPTPNLVFEDIDGVESSSAHYDGRIQVVTFADRESSEDLMTWMLKAGPEVLARHPSIQIAYLGFADLQAVPSMFEHFVTPALRSVNSRSEEAMTQAYRNRGIELNPEAISYHLTADWDGAYLDQFGLGDAQSFHCFVVQDGTIVAHFDNQVEDVAKRYISLMDKLMSEKHEKARVKLTTAQL